MSDIKYICNKHLEDFWKYASGLELGKSYGLLNTALVHYSTCLIDLNLFQSNLLASGANDSEIYIWDLNNFNNPMTPGTKTQVNWTSNI